jgi:5-methylcytosine-specific restriction protein A
MPSKPLKPCTRPGCPALVKSGRCDECKRKGGGEQRRAPWSVQAHRWYASPRWREARERFFATHPLCIQCEGEGRVVPATVVDHVRPHRGSAVLFWDKGNWQALCESCHNAKSAREQHHGGGGARARKVGAA